MTESEDNMAEIKEVVLGIVAKYVAPDEIQEKMDDVFSIDSLDLVDIVIEIEKAFGIKFANEEVQSLETFDELMSMIQRKRAAGAATA